MKAIHILSNIDQEAKTGICANCGPTSLRSIGVNKWRCGAYKKRKDSEYRERNADSIQGYMRHYYRDNKEIFRNNHLKSKYGLTQADYVRMLADQNGVCKLCFGPPAGTGAKNGIFHVDHCHETMEIRGLLCGRCNIAIGAFRNDPELMRRAADYLS